MIKYRLFKTNQFKRSYRKLKFTDTQKELPLREIQKLLSPNITKVERNEQILKAIELGYSQNAIADVLKVTQGTISHVL